ncbi:hypothetical protein FRC03_004573 [Tulasnella sp. 419]|nr:hypothetical protein FRC03_004573 [Tulasnella sp. 419]
MWMEQKSHTATELIESAWGNDRSSGVRNALAWFRATVDSYSDYFLPMILIMLVLVLGYSIYVMVTRVKRASGAGSGKAEADVDNLPKRLLRSLGSFIVSSLRLMASLVPYPVYLLAYIKPVKDMADIGFKFLHATWSDEWARGGQQYLSWIGMEVDGLSNDFLRLVLAIVGLILVSRMCMVLSRIRRAGACHRDDAKVVIVGPNNSLKHRLCSLCTYLVSSLGNLVFSVIYLAIHPITIVVYGLNLIKLVFKGCIVCIAWFFQSIVPRRTVAPAPPIAVSSPPEVTSPVEVSLPVPECGTPATDSLPASANKVNIVDLQKLKNKYGEVKKVAGSRLVQGGKGVSPKKVAGASNLD